MTKFKIFAAFAIAGLLFSSCQKKDDFTADEVSAALKTGTWRISSYTEDGTDQTSQFSGFNFTFNENGSALCVHASDSTSGTWSTSDSNDDDHSHLVLNFGTVSPLDELADDWHVTNQTDVLIELEDVSGGNGGTDILVFTKN